MLYSSPKTILMKINTVATSMEYILKIRKFKGRPKTKIWKFIIVLNEVEILSIKAVKLA